MPGDGVSERFVLEETVTGFHLRIQGESRDGSR